MGAYLGAYLGTYLGCSAGFWACWGWFFGGAGLSSPNTIDDWLWYFAGLEEDCTFLGWLWGLVVAPSQGEVALAARSVVDLDGGFVRLPDIALGSFHCIYIFELENDVGFDGWESTRNLSNTKAIIIDVKAWLTHSSAPPRALPKHHQGSSQTVQDTSQKRQ